MEIGIPLRIIPKAMQRKAKNLPRMVSGYMSPYPTVEMLTCTGSRVGENS